MAETRKGFVFNNPDIDSNYMAPKWGLLVTADELRYNEMFGNALVAEVDGASITDDMLNDYGRVATRFLEVELNIDILPRRIRYDNLIDESGAVVTRTDFDDSVYFSKMNRKQLKELYLRESGYSYLVNVARHECRIKLRRRPVRDILSANFVDPYFGNTIVDLMPYRIVKKDFTGVCYFRPRQLTARTNTYIQTWQNYIFAPYNSNRQSIFLIDYETGYENCQDVPDEFRNIIQKIAACTLMNIYGDGRTAAIASKSVNLNSVSESISTTMSATNAMFGARIIQYQKEIKEWLKQNRSKYSRTIIGVL